MDFDRFEALTFDCYGTLIDWERGILDALRPALSRGELPDDEPLLEAFAGVEADVQSGSYAPYRQILFQVVRTLGSQLGIEVGREAAERFAGSVVDWPAFGDSSNSLEALSARYRLAIVSNVDDDLFAGSAARLGVSFDEIVTAEQVRSYKPTHAHFHEALKRLELPRERVLHVAQSLFHDIAPAKELGFTTVWVNRRAGKGGAGATAPSSATPDFEVPDMRAVVALLGLGPA
jgi:2-haloacid dehalogenase